MTPPARDPSVDGVIAALVAENLALRCIAGGGCDANEDGPHPIIVGTGKNTFCADCGDMVCNGKSKPWINDERIERAVARIRARLQEQQP